VATFRSRKALLAATVLVAALSIRIGYIERTPYHAINDAGSYNKLASEVARTGDYATGSGPKSGAGGSRGPTAYFPPGYPYFLAAVDLIDGHQAGGKTAVGPERISQAILGTVTVGLIGMVALEAFGAPTALVALILAALYPVLIELSGVLVAENLMVAFELAALWTALRARRSRHPYAWIAATGVLTGLATLTHENTFVIVLPLAFAVAQVARGLPPGRARATKAVALLLASTAITILPWTLRNAVELHHLVPVSDESGITLVGTYNPTSAGFKRLPYKWRLFTLIPQDAKLKRDSHRYKEVALSEKLQSQALHYIAAHPLSPLEVAYHNTLRMFELEGSYAWHASAYAQGLKIGVARTGVAAFWLLCVLALAGAFTRAAREGPRWMWAIPVLLALTVVLINVETPRFREPIDPFLILLASCALVTGLTRGVERLGPRRYQDRFGG
jgi:4-amino-4-deoxy-L-arabinose transferase-like glycosyltransferase